VTAIMRASANANKAAQHADASWVTCASNTCRCTCGTARGDTPDDLKGRF